MMCRWCGGPLVRWHGGTAEYPTHGWQCAKCSAIQGVVRRDDEAVAREWGFRSWAAMAAAVDTEERLQREIAR